MHDFIYSQPLVEAFLPQLKTAAAALPVAPQLAVVLVGDNPASQIYVKRKKAFAEEIGCQCVVHQLGKGTTQELLAETLRTLNQQPDIHGIILQLPLPAELNAGLALNLIRPEKDVDGLTVTSWHGLKEEDPQTLLPATPVGILRLLDWLNVDLTATPTVVVGRSRLVGGPLAELLRQRGALVTSFSKEHPIQLPVIQDARVVVSAAGEAGLITAAMINPAATVIDVGINTQQTASQSRKIVGDVAPEVVLKAAHLTAVPGGVGRMTVLSLMTNLIDAATMQQGQPRPVWQVSPQV